MAIDPVCGMKVDEETGTEQYVHESTTYYFCCKGCRLDFEDEPEKFVKSGPEPRPGHH